MGRRNSNWIVLAPDRLGKLGSSGAGVAHGRRTARVSQSRRVRGASEEPDPGIALAAALLANPFGVSVFYFLIFTSYFLQVTRVYRERAFRQNQQNSQNIRGE